jgi:ABC-type transport system involved in cytochrome c biogenesis permease subunit
MIDYNSFYIASSVFWFLSIVFIFLSFKKGNIFLQLGLLFNFIAIVIIGAFVCYLWQKLNRPPMRTLGETRLWYSLFLPIIGLVFYIRWKYVWILFYTIGMAFLFLTLNFMNPDMYSQTLMPALQSPWFVPHVIVYLFSYAALGVSCIVAIKELFKPSSNGLQIADNLVYIGTSFLTLGLLFGALWAKEAWGHYWTWDPKETWAFLTWTGYILYIHYRFYHPKEDKKAMCLLASAFILLLICWFGVNYLPIAKNSVHTYTQS